MHRTTPSAGVACIIAPSIPASALRVAFQISATRFGSDEIRSTVAPGSESSATRSFSHTIGSISRALAARNFTRQEQQESLDGWIGDAVLRLVAAPDKRLLPEYEIRTITQGILWQTRDLGDPPGAQVGQQRELSRAQ